MYAHTSRSVQLASGLNFHSPCLASQPASEMSERVGDCSRRMPVIQASSPLSASRSGVTLRMPQQAAGSVAHRPSGGSSAANTSTLVA